MKMGDAIDLHRTFFMPAIYRYLIGISILSYPLS